MSTPAGPRRGLLKSSSSSKRKTRRQDLWRPARTVNSSCRTNCPCSLRLTCKGEAQEMSSHPHSPLLHVLPHMAWDDLHHSPGWHPWLAGHCHVSAGSARDSGLPEEHPAPVLGPHRPLPAPAVVRHICSCAGLALVGRKPNPGDLPVLAASPAI